MSPWTIAFSVNFLFQLYRGNLQDIIIFALALTLIALESTHYLDWIPEFKSLRFSKVNIGVLALSGIYILFAKLDTNLTLWVFALIFLFMFLALWRREDGERRKLTARELRSAWSWSFIGIGLCIWELIAFVLAEVFRDDYSYPTISVLIEPYINDRPFRAIFIFLWCSGGYLLLKDWGEPA